MKGLLDRRAAVGQIVVVALAIAMIAFWPPPRGAMLMVPLSGDVGGVFDVALSTGTSLLGVGPLPGSMIVMADRATLGGPAFGRGILLLSAPRILCGETETGASRR